MRLWKQMIISLALVIAGFFVWVMFVPGAASTLEAFGLPTQIVAALSPEAAKDGGDVAGGKPSRRGEGRRDGPPLVVTRPVESGIVNDRLNAIGSGEAIRSVIVTPQVSGTITEITIVSGDKVAKGQVVARLDTDEQNIALDQAKVSLRSAEEKSQIYRNVKSTVPRMDVFNAEIAEETAKLAVQTAEFNLKRRAILAPIDGIVGIVPVNVGDNADTQTAIVSLDDRSEILVDFWIPERFIRAVKVGMPITATSIARPGELFSGSIEAVDNRVDQASRTLRVRARIPNNNDELRAGMSFSVTMQFSGETFPAIDPLAVQWDSSGAFVWRIDANKADKIPVRIIQRNPENVLVQADLKTGDAVAIEGLLRLRAGIEVRTGAKADETAEATQ